MNKTDKPREFNVYEGTATQLAVRFWDLVGDPKTLWKALEKYGEETVKRKFSKIKEQRFYWKDGRCLVNLSWIVDETIQEWRKSNGKKPRV